MRLAIMLVEGIAGEAGFPCPATLVDIQSNPWVELHRDIPVEISHQGKAKEAFLRTKLLIHHLPQVAEPPPAAVDMGIVPKMLEQMLPLLDADCTPDSIGKLQQGAFADI